MSSSQTRIEFKQEKNIQNIEFTKKISQINMDVLLDPGPQFMRGTKWILSFVGSMRAWTALVCIT